MKRFFLLLFLILVSLPALAGEKNQPDQALTPGEILTTDIDLVCRKGYSATVRRTTGAMKRKAYRDYGIHGPHKGYKIDHRVPLALGGADSQKNIWPSDFNAPDHNAADKDRLELKILHLVCSRRLRIEKGQALFLANWQDAYDRYCPSRKACPSYKELQEQRSASDKNGKRP